MTFYNDPCGPLWVEKYSKTGEGLEDVTVSTSRAGPPVRPDRAGGRCGHGPDVHVTLTNKELPGLKSCVEMAVFRVERTRDYTVISNFHLKDMNLSLKAKGLLSVMLSLPETWNYTTRGLAAICKEDMDAIGSTVRDLEASDYIAACSGARADGSPTPSTSSTSSPRAGRIRRPRNRPRRIRLIHRWEGRVWLRRIRKTRTRRSRMWPDHVRKNPPN